MHWVAPFYTTNRSRSIDAFLKILINSRFGCFDSCHKVFFQLFKVKFELCRQRGTYQELEDI